MEERKKYVKKAEEKKNRGENPSESKGNGEVGARYVDKNLCIQ